jgi:hypothetical protein
MKKISDKIILKNVHGKQCIKMEKIFSQTVQEDNWKNLTL